MHRFPSSLRATWSLAGSLFLGTAQFARAQFAPDDEIRLRRDEPLEFKGSIFRQGHQGETFSVLKYDAASGKIYVLATGNDGKPFALSVADRAVEVLPKDLLLFMQKGAAALRQTDLATARAMFVKAAVGRFSEKAAVDLAARTDVLQKTIAALAEARKARERALPEIQRLLKNAQTIDHPNPLFPGNGNELRAQEIRDKATQLQQQVTQGIELAEGQFIQALTEDMAASEQLVESGFLSVAVDVSDGLNALAAAQLPGRGGGLLHFSLNRAEISQRIAIASAAATKAQTALDTLHLYAAREIIQKGLTAEPGRAELRRFSARIDADLERVNANLLTIDNLRESLDFEQALAEVTKAEKLVVDSPSLQSAGEQLRKLIGEKRTALATAKATESAGNPIGALALYDRYGMKAEAARILPSAAQAAEATGNFMQAYTFYERAGASVEMARLSKLNDQQQMAYRAAAVSLAEGQYAEAIAVYDRYHDTAAKNEAMTNRASRLEAEGKYEEARILYREAGAAGEMQRLVEWLDNRTRWLAEGQAAEAAGDLERAQDVFQKANARPDFQRVAIALGKKSELAKNYTAAADYFEQGADYPKAAEMRKLAESQGDTGAALLGSASTVFRRCAPASVTVISTGRGLGSGFFVAKGGYLLTNRHVIENSRSLTVLVPGGERYPAEVVAVSEQSDLALLKTEIRRDHPCLSVADSDAIKAGEQVYALGSPEGLPQNISEGVVSNTERQYHGNRCFQISVAINQGNSGGPLVDNRGRVVGINTFVGRPGEGLGSDTQGLNLAIKANEARSLLQKAGL